MSSKKIIEIREIEKLIPHRYPFLLVDRIIDYEPNEYAVGIKNVTYGDHFFTGHFPGEPIMPGVLMVEAMAQTAAILVAKGYRLSLEVKPAETEADQSETEAKGVLFMSIEEVKFRKPVTPGDRLELHVKVLKNRRDVWKFEGQGIVDGAKVVEAVFSAMVYDKQD